MITTATSSGTPARRGRSDRMLAQSGQDACLMRPGHLRWALGHDAVRLFRPAAPGLS
jgi:hypothetical protein